MEGPQAAQEVDRVLEQLADRLEVGLDLVASAQAFDRLEELEAIGRDVMTLAAALLRIRSERRG
jgi:hypothetical protein